MDHLVTAMIWTQKKGSNANEPYVTVSNEFTTTSDKRSEITNRMIERHGLPFRTEQNSSYDIESCLMYWNNHGIIKFELLDHLDPMDHAL